MTFKEITNSVPALTDETFEGVVRSLSSSKGTVDRYPLDRRTVGGATEGGARGEATVHLGDEWPSSGVYVK